MSASFKETFELYLDDSRYSVPTLHLIVADNERAAMETARQMMAANPHYRGAEICQEGQRLGGLGSFSTRTLPPEAHAASRL